MAILFWDSSAIVKRYFAEEGNAAVQTLLSNVGHAHFIAPITLAEVSSAIVRRAPPSHSVALLAAFDDDVQPDHILGVLDLPADAFTRAVTLVRVHRLRGCDALQLAVAQNWAAVFQELDEVSANDFVFVCADDDLNRAAQSEGLAVMNPARP